MTRKRKVRTAPQNSSCHGDLEEICGRANCPQPQKTKVSHARTRDDVIGWYTMPKHNIGRGLVHLPPSRLLTSSPWRRRSAPPACDQLSPGGHHADSSISCANFTTADIVFLATTLSTQTSTHLVANSSVENHVAETVTQTTSCPSSTEVTSLLRTSQCAAPRHLLGAFTPAQSREDVLGWDSVPEPIRADAADSSISFASFTELGKRALPSTTCSGHPARRSLSQASER